jgi:hypothetical protein
MKQLISIVDIRVKTSQDATHLQPRVNASSPASYFSIEPEVVVDFTASTNE